MISYFIIEREYLAYFVQEYMFSIEQANGHYGIGKKKTSRDVKV